jgi:hypothetical protein
MRDGVWTLDAMSEMCKDVTFDINGDNVLDHHDSFGFGNNYSGTQEFVCAGGGRYAVLDSDGKPVITFGDDIMVQAAEKVIAFFNDFTRVIWTDNIKGVSNAWAELNNMVMDDRLLFRAGNIYNIKQFRVMEGDFGILPTPKLDDTIADYQNGVMTHACIGYSIPQTVSDTDKVAILLEAIAYESNIVKDAYYETTLTGKITRDEESRESLDIIFGTAYYDLGKVFGWGKLQNALDNAVKAGGGFVSQYEKVKEKAQLEMEDTYNSFLDIAA